MRYKLLPEVCDIQYGYAFDSKLFSDNVGTPIVRIRDVVRGYSETKTSELCPDNYNVENGDILIGMDGEFNIAKWNGGHAVLNQRVCKLIPKNQEIESDYLFFYMPKALKAIEDKTPFVTVKHLSAKELNKIIVPIPNRERQITISNQLKLLNTLLGKYNRIDTRLDELIKSRFVEMFGDPVSNSLGWQTILMKRLASKIGSGATPKGGRESYGTEGISLIRSMNVYNGCFEYKDLAYISDDQAKKLENVVIQENDVLLNITGASVARCCIVPDGILPARVNQHVCIIRCNNKIIPKYLCHLLIDDNYQRFLLDLAGSGATREAITKQQIEELSIIIPPIKLQNQFADFATKVEIQKATVQQSIDKLETLKKSLTQDYFG